MRRIRDPTQTDCSKLRQLELSSAIDAKHLTSDGRFKYDVVHMIHGCEAHLGVLGLRHRAGAAAVLEGAPEGVRAAQRHDVHVLQALRAPPGASSMRGTPLWVDDRTRRGASGCGWSPWGGVPGVFTRPSTMNTRVSVCVCV